jgi:hypothetical protein
MYSSSPDLSDLEAPQLMQLVALAQRYGVVKVVAAAATQLRQLTIGTMPLATAAAVIESPEACRALGVLQPVYKTAASKLQHELGDLEVVWGDVNKRSDLLGLPLGALLQLLGDERTRVASEDTILFTAAKWLEYHPGAESQASQLSTVLRLPRCTASCLTSSSTKAFLSQIGITEDERCSLAAM